MVKLKQLVVKNFVNILLTKKWGKKPYFLFIIKKKKKNHLLSLFTKIWCISKMYDQKITKKQ